MERNSLARWLKVMILGSRRVRVGCIRHIFPMFGQSLIWQHPELDGWFLPMAHFFVDYRRSMLCCAWPGVENRRPYRAG